MFYGLLCLSKDCVLMNDGCSIWLCVIGCAFRPTALLPSSLKLRHRDAQRPRLEVHRHGPQVLQDHMHAPLARHIRGPQSANSS